MYFKSLFLIASFVINLGSSGGLYSDEIKSDIQKKSVSTLLNDYYKEFKKPDKVIINTDSAQNDTRNQGTLVRYYSEYLK